MIRILAAFCFLWGLCLGLQGDVLAGTDQLLFSTGNEEVPQAGLLLNASETHRVPHQGKEYQVLDEKRDPYSKSLWLFDFNDYAQRDVECLVIEVTFLDRGVGVIQPELLVDDSFQGQWSQPVRKVSFTRLNTQAVRKALFEFEKPELDLNRANHPGLRISGLQYLHSIRVFAGREDADWKALSESIPTKVEPLLRLERPIQVNCTVGIEDVGNPPSLENSLANIREYAPLAKLLGFTSIECFVRWDMLEPEPGRFDFSHYDRLVEEIRKYDLKWFPNLVITSAFALPKWYYSGDENIGMVCLEHHLENEVPSIWNTANREHVTRVLQAFGKHYEPMNVLEAVRLGPSGNFGEAQYPAGAGSSLGFHGKPMHAHIGWWCGDERARTGFQRFLKERYGEISKLNERWEESFPDFESIEPSLPETYRTRHGRLDLTEWTTQSMTDWCAFWAKEARDAMPNTPIYQSSGGWGFREAGTDFSAQAESMQRIGGGIRLTNETDSFEQNFYATRLAATSARLYGISLGYEPAGYHSARGVVARFFSTATTGATNLYTRHSVLFTDPYSVDNWLRDYPLLDKRANPIIDVAVYYPETMNQLDDGTFRHLYAWGFNPRAAEIRRRIDLDFLDDRLIREGFLDRYKVLVFCWGPYLPKEVLERIDAWIRKGGVAIFPTFPRGDYQSVEGDGSIFRAWERGDTGKGKFFRFKRDMEPITLYGDYVESILQSLEILHPWTQRVLDIEHPPHVFFSVLESGEMFILNYSDQPAELILDPKGRTRIAPLSIGVCPLEEG